ncbi:SurA N-terminal domain-containing protein [Desulfatirhabdium butyrativorans]|uniref:SurA N-terminal domain-containing protein n=1 Tax=Desulfatirhabdium butyrativorans TaxID=340467 RepID=UPI0012EC2384|nr:SurA N-terminal domain-containing protein [Desulfatirhabdium butyrativorans]
MNIYYQDFRNMKPNISRPVSTSNRVVFGFIFVFSLFLMPCRIGAEVADRIVAVVNDDIITLAELNEAMKPYEQKILSSGYTPERERQMLFKVREDILNQLIEQKLTDQEIARNKLTVSENEIDQTIERIKKANSMTDEGFRAALAREGITMAEYRKKMKEQLLRANLLNKEVKSKIVITRQDVQKYYNDHPELYQVSLTYHLETIIARPEASRTDISPSVCRNALEKLLPLLKAGKPFSEIVSAVSQPGLDIRQIDLGEYRLDVMASDIRSAVAKMKPGEYSDIIETDQGFQIFRVLNTTKGEGKSLEEATPEIENKLYKDVLDETFNKWLQELRSKSVIKIIQ